MNTAHVSSFFTYQEPHILLFLVDGVRLKARVFVASDEVLTSLYAKKLIKATQMTYFSPDRSQAGIY